MRPSATSTCVATATLMLIVVGCASWNDQPFYLGEKPVEHYKNVAETIDHATVWQPTPDSVRFTQRPRTIEDVSTDSIRDVRLSEAIQQALMNSPIIRSSGTFLSAGNSIYTNANGTSSVYDAAIQESGVLFGGRGMEAALSAFDAQVTSSMTWGRNEVVAGGVFSGMGVPLGATNVADTGMFRSQLQKQFGHGGLITLGHDWDYRWDNTGTNLFPSFFRGSTQATYRHPLLAGSGTEFTRIAGPIAQSFGGLSGVTQGVVIARINNDLTLADFEAAVRNMLLDVENTYWDLYMSYRRYDTSVAAQKSAYQTWRESKIKFDIGTLKAADEAQARDRLHETEAAAQAAFAGVLDNELRLRRLMGLAVNDGMILRPVDEPTSSEFVAEWQSSLAEALTKRVELRKQKWNIKSLELQQRAATSLIRPRMDFIGTYRVNGFGDQLLSQEDQDQRGTLQGLNSAYETLTQGNQTGWELGLSLTMPIGFRSEQAQLRNIELRLAKARAVLETQEHEISMELASAFQSLVQHYKVGRSNFGRREAARTRVEKLSFELQEGTITPDPLVRAQASLSDAENAYFQSLVDYNKQIAHLHYRKGTLLEYNNVHLAEGGWEPGAYNDAMRRALARAHAMDARYLHSEPAEFASPYPVGAVELAPLDISETEPKYEPPPAPEPDDTIDVRPEPADADAQTNGDGNGTVEWWLSGAGADRDRQSSKPRRSLSAELKRVDRFDRRPGLLTSGGFAVPPLAGTERVSQIGFADSESKTPKFDVRRANGTDRSDRGMDAAFSDSRQPPPNPVRVPRFPRRSGRTASNRRRNAQTGMPSVSQWIQENVEREPTPGTTKSRAVSAEHVDVETAPAPRQSDSGWISFDEFRDSSRR